MAAGVRGPLRGVSPECEQRPTALVFENELSKSPFGTPPLDCSTECSVCGDAGHILLSKHVAEDLEHYGHWQPLLHDLGTCEAKQDGLQVFVANHCLRDNPNQS